jgi:putative colanic acid biosynthesis UDP-glucose lipid carrier transferase
LDHADASLPLSLERRSALGRSHFAGDERALLLGGLRVADAAALIVSGALAYELWHGELSVPGLYWLYIVIGAALGAQALSVAGRYGVERLWRGALARSCVGWGGAVLLVVALIYFAGEGKTFSRAWTVLWWVGGCAGLSATDFCFRRLLRSWQMRGRLTSRVAVFGAPPDAERVGHEIEEEASGYRRVVAICHQASGGGGAEQASELDDLVRLARQVRIDEAVLTLSCQVGPEIREALVRLGSLPIDVKLYLRLLSPADEAAFELPAIQIHRRPLAGGSALVKRTADVVLSGLALVAFLPLMACIAALVKLDSRGPVIYRQRRAGFNLNVFVVYKFRTMYESSGDAEVIQAQRDDARVTRVGKVLRQLSLDELPQLFNVLRGEMSLVGPRPHAVPHDQKYGRLIDGYLRRHRVLPGITGWAQVNGWRGETDTLEKMRARIEHDVWYIEHWSLALDLKILIRTALIALGDKHAY